MSGRQIKAVAEALRDMPGWGHVFRLENETQDIARVAIAASDARLVPGLVEALRYYAEEGSYWRVSDGGKCHEMTNADQGTLAREALASLPEEYRK